MEKVHIHMPNGNVDVSECHMKMIRDMKKGKMETKQRGSGERREKNNFSSYDQVHEYFY